MTPTLAAFVWAVGLVAWVIIRVPHRSRARKTRVASSAKTLRDRLALAAAAAGLSLVPIVFVATGFPAFADYTFQPWLGWLGLLIELAFLWLFYASHRQLGKNWSVTLEIRNEHKLVTDGLYRYVRHPMYLSFWLWAAAQFCLLPNAIAGAAGLVGVGNPLFLPRSSRRGNDARRVWSILRRICQKHRPHHSQTLVTQ